MGIIDLFQRIDDMYGLSPEEQREAENTIEAEVDAVNAHVSREAKGSKEPQITTADVAEKAKEASERTDVVGWMSQNIPAFRECDDWKDVAKIVSRETVKVQKEMFFIEVFAGGVCLIVIDRVSPFGRFILGPLMINIGYSHSEFLKKFVPKNAVDSMSKVEVGRARGEKPAPDRDKDKDRDRDRG